MECIDRDLTERERMRRLCEQMSDGNRRRPYAGRIKNGI